MSKKKRPISRSENMSRVKASNTSIEKLLCKELWTRGLRYRKNDADIYGKPDVSFRGKRVVVFCDSEFWHGKDFMEGKNIPKSNADFWITKLKKNIERDKQVNQTLEEKGWTVIRLWAKQIKRDVVHCADLIEQTLKQKET
jgi:DNA mismatch endonuclease (patch repair protein)